jgi:hypothetical protein
MESMEWKKIEDLKRRCPSIIDLNPISVYQVQVNLGLTFD